MDVQARRNLLATSDNPDSRLDYVVTLSGRLGGGDDAAQVAIRYVPDRAILEEGCFTAYLDALGGTDWPTLEAAATAILDDLNNEVVARWVQVTVSTGAERGERGVEHSVYLEDRQPTWDNPALLARLRRG